MRATITEVRDLAVKLMHQHGLTDAGWGFRTDRARSRTGQCDHTSRIITMSEILIPLRCLEDNRRTILHEIAHALTRGHHHDRVWQLKCIEIGLDNPTRGYHDEQGVIARATANWVGTCPGGHHIYRVRLTDRSRNRISCAQCSSVYSPANVFTWKRVTP